MNKDQGIGLFERLIYVAVLAIAMKLVGRGWIDTDTAIYIAVTAQGLPSLLWSWWINRPTALLNSASAQLPKNTELTITTNAHASHADKVEAHALAASANDKVTAKTTA